MASLLRDDIQRHPCFSSPEIVKEVERDIAELEKKLMHLYALMGEECVVLRINVRSESLRKVVLSDPVLKQFTDGLRRDHSGPDSWLVQCCRRMNGSSDSGIFSSDSCAITKARKILGRKEYLLQCLKTCISSYGRLAGVTADHNLDIRQLMSSLRLYVEKGHRISAPALAYLTSGRNDFEDWLPIVVTPDAEYVNCLPLLWNVKKPPLCVQRNLKVNSKGQPCSDKRKSIAAKHRGSLSLALNGKKRKRKDNSDPL